MVERHLSSKFAINSFGGFRKMSFTDARTTDAHVTTLAMLCSSTNYGHLYAIFWQANIKAPGLLVETAI